MFDRLQKRIGEKAGETFIAAVDKTATAVEAAVGTGVRIKALTDDPDESITIESMVLVFVDAVRDESHGERPGSRAEVIAAYKGRQRLTKWISRLGLWGAAAGSLSTLYSEAAILCDVADAAQVGLSREQLGARILLLWGVMPDFEEALAALNREGGRSVAASLKARLPAGFSADNPERMSKRQVVALLWKLRGLRKGKAGGGKVTVEEMIDNVEGQLRPHIVATQAPGGAPATSVPGTEVRPRKDAVLAWSRDVFAEADLAPTSAQLDDIASSMAGSIVTQVLVPLADERGASGFRAYLGAFDVSEQNILEHLDAACGVLALMIVRAGGHDPVRPDDPALVEAEDEIDFRMRGLLDLALPEWSKGVLQEYGE